VKAVVDTNVLLVANEQHAEASSECIEACILRLLAISAKGVVVIDDGYRILGEYLHKTRLHPPKRVGDVFLKELLRNAGNSCKVQQVALHETAENCFTEFPDPGLEPLFDAPDRMFVAVAHAHPDNPPVWQAVDCKWLDWWPALMAAGVAVDFVCPADACRFYGKKFPNRSLPAFP
jgi:hypothetical protein